MTNKNADGMRGGMRGEAGRDVSTRLAMGLFGGGDSVRGQDNEKMAQMACLSGRTSLI